MWEETRAAKEENRRELVLPGSIVKKRIQKSGLDRTIYQLKDLNYLSITQTGLDKLEPDFFNLINLQTLILHSNKLELIDDNLAKLPKLKILDLSSNCIKAIPASLASLNEIAILNLANNQLESFPSLTNNGKLAVLDLSHNKLSSFPDVCTRKLAVLSELKLQGNQIPEIPSGISELPALKVIDASNNNISVVPGELADCSKLKDINLKSNPISDRRLLKLIDQCRTKQIIDYIKRNCPKTTIGSANEQKKVGKSRKDTDNSSNDDLEIAYSQTITVQSAGDKFKVILDPSVKSIREHIVCCIVDNINFTEETFKDFIKLQNKLHDGICNKRNSATLATHDFNKLGCDSVTYTTYPANELRIKPLNNPTEMTGADLFAKLQADANQLRREKKRNTYSGIHKYLYLIEGKLLYPCVLNEKGEVISFPPITNSDITKMEQTTSKMFVEVTSSIGQQICKTVLDTLLAELTTLLKTDLLVQQVKVIDPDGKLKVVYPSKTDLKFDENVPIRVVRN